MTDHVERLERAVLNAAANFGKNATPSLRRWIERHADVIADLRRKRRGNVGAVGNMPYAEINARLRLIDGTWVFDCDEEPGLYIAHKDLSLVLRDIIPAWEMLKKLDAGDTPSPPREGREG